MKAVFSNRVGFLGAGQLAQMMGDAAISLGLRPEYISAVQAPSSIDGTIPIQADLDHLLRTCRWIVFENEFVSVPALRAAAERVGREPGETFFPDLSVIEVLQNKQRQKELFLRLKLPTAPFEAFPEGQDVGDEILKSEWLKNTLTRFQGRAVFKWASHGYDGKGVCLSARATSAELRNFCDTAWDRGLGLYAEAEVDYVRELAMVAVVGAEGFIHYPLVCSEQEHGVCREVKGPAVSLGVATQHEVESVRMMRVIADELGPQGLRGAFALEAFETRAGELWINELAPRVHNTGHYTMDAAKTSQFENHLRAVVGRPLGSVATAPYFTMRNLLGPPHLSPRSLSEATFPASNARIWAHNYRKTECRPLRKLGHLNAVADSPAELAERAAEMIRIENQWIRSLE